MQRRMLKTFGVVAGCVSVVLLLASIAGSLIAPQDERCDACLRLMVPMYEMELRDSVVTAYRCPNQACDQRGQRTVWKDGRREWQEW